MTRESRSKASKDTSASATSPSNETVTCSNRRIEGRDSWVMASGLQEPEDDLGHQRIQHENQHVRCHHRLRGRAAYSLRAARGAQAVKAADQRDGYAEQQGLE